MNQPLRDAGILAVLADRLVKLRLPRLVDMKAQVDRGEVLTDHDIRFLGEAIADAQGNAALIERNPDVQEIVGKVLRLYKEIMDKALENETAGKS